jgi:hypothetical protein
MTVIATLIPQIPLLNRWALWYSLETTNDSNKEGSSSERVLLSIDFRTKMWLVTHKCHYLNLSLIWNVAALLSWIRVEKQRRIRKVIAIGCCGNQKYINPLRSLAQCQILAHIEIGRQSQLLSSTVCRRISSAIKYCKEYWKKSILRTPSQVHIQCYPAVRWRSNH